MTGTLVLSEVVPVRRAEVAHTAIGKENDESVVVLHCLVDVARH